MTTPKTTASTILADARAAWDASPDGVLALAAAEATVPPLRPAPAPLPGYRQRQGQQDRRAAAEKTRAAAVESLVAPQRDRATRKERAALTRAERTAAKVAAVAAARAAEVRLSLAPLRQALLASYRGEPTVSASDRVAVGCETIEDWDRYSKGWHRAHGPARTVCPWVRVREDWAAAVHAHGLTVCDGLVTIEAATAEAPAGYAAFAATWIEQGRGYEPRIERGVIVRAEGRDARTAHAATVDAGVALLRRRARAEWVDAASAAVDLAEHRDCPVTIGHAARAGLCLTGARSWCARAGIDADAGTTIGGVLDALAAGAGLDAMALSACRLAVRRAVRRTEHAAVSA